MKLRMEWTYRSPKHKELQFVSEELSVGEAIHIAEDLEKTGRTKQLKLIDSFDSTWSLKELKRYMKELETEPHEVAVYYDGGFDRREKKAGLGCAIYFKQNGKAFRWRKNALVDELESNNEAEFAALWMAVQELESLGVHHLPVRFIGDSRTLVSQMSEEWAIGEQSLASWADRIDRRLEKIGIRAEYEYVPRKENGEADRLATQALQHTEIESLIELHKTKK